MLQEELAQMQADVQKRIQETERKLSEIPHFARQHKVTVAMLRRVEAGWILILRSVPHSQALVQALQQESTDTFAQLVKDVSLAGARVGELLSNHEASLGSQVEGHVNSLEQEVKQLRWRSADLSLLADVKDPVCFLKVRKHQVGFGIDVVGKYYSSFSVPCGAELLHHGAAAAESRRVVASRGGGGGFHPRCHKGTPRVGAGPVQNQPGNHHLSMSVVLLV